MKEASSVGIAVRTAKPIRLLNPSSEDIEKKRGKSKREENLKNINQLAKKERQ